MCHPHGEPVAELRPVQSVRKTFISRDDLAACPARVSGSTLTGFGATSTTPAIVGEGRKRRSRFADLLIAATAHANGLDLYSRNADDFVGLANLVRVVAV